MDIQKPGCLQGHCPERGWCEVRSIDWEDDEVRLSNGAVTWWRKLSETTVRVNGSDVPAPEYIPTSTGNPTVMLDVETLCSTREKSILDGPHLFVSNPAEFISKTYGIHHGDPVEWTHIVLRDPVSRGVSVMDSELYGVKVPTQDRPVVLNANTFEKPTRKELLKMPLRMPQPYRY